MEGKSKANMWMEREHGNTNNPVTGKRLVQTCEQESKPNTKRYESLWFWSFLKTFSQAYEAHLWGICESHGVNKFPREWAHRSIEKFIKTMKPLNLCASIDAPPQNWCTFPRYLIFNYYWISCNWIYPIWKEMKTMLAHIASTEKERKWCPDLHVVVPKQQLIKSQH